ncbi:MAG: hypothetical protein NZU63_08630 [Gemmataceae bacterium]|nr:hypothetical protein [Gemmataceae bacterium]MDW8243147.1 hypothetical protein [Thermogemmata sp.]
MNLAELRELAGIAPAQFLGQDALTAFVGQFMDILQNAPNLSLSNLIELVPPIYEGSDVANRRLVLGKILEKLMLDEGPP